jgi:hypothetical protein
MAATAGAPGKVIHVTENAKSAKIEESARTENWAEVSLSPVFLGNIDSDLRFKPTPKHGPNGVVILRWTTVTFALVLANRQWKLNSDGGRENEATGPLQWLIDCDQRDVWISKEVAIRYVKEMRDQAIDSAIKKNAGETIAALEKIH